MPLQEQGPERVRNRREEAEVKHQRPGIAGYSLQLPAAEQGCRSHDEAADEKLPTAENNRVLPVGKALDQHGRAAVGRSREKQKAFP